MRKLAFKLLVVIQLLTVSDLFSESDKYNYAGIDWQNGDYRITENFTVKEVFSTGKSTDWARRDYIWTLPYEERIDILNNILSMAQKLETLREKYGPIKIMSWYRDPEANSKVGGKTTSKHVQGLAVDIRPLNFDGYELQDELQTSWQGGVGLGWNQHGFIHIDLGPKRTWNY